MQSVATCPAEQPTTIAWMMAAKFDVLDVVPFGEGWRVYVRKRPTSQAAVQNRVRACGLTLRGYGVDVARGEAMYVVVA